MPSRKRCEVPSGKCTGMLRAFSADCEPTSSARTDVPLPRGGRPTRLRCLDCEFVCRGRFGGGEQKCECPTRRGAKKVLDSILLDFKCDYSIDISLLSYKNFTTIPFDYSDSSDTMAETRKKVVVVGMH